MCSLVFKVSEMAKMILVVTRGQNSHLKRLEQLFERAKEYNDRFKPAKCEFMQDRVVFYGVVVSQSGIQANPAKIKEVQAFKVPEGKSDVQSFLGLVSYISHFLPDPQAKMQAANTLRAVCKLDKFAWSEEATNAFNLLKAAAANSDNLAFFKVGRRIKLYVDASPIGLGVVATQEQQDGTYAPFRYCSKVLTSAEQMRLS